MYFAPFLLALCFYHIAFCMKIQEKYFNERNDLSIEEHEKGKQKMMNKDLNAKGMV